MRCRPWICNWFVLRLHFQLIFLRLDTESINPNRRILVWQKIARRVRTQTSVLDVQFPEYCRIIKEQKSFRLVSSPYFWFADPTNNLWTEKRISDMSRTQLKRSASPWEEKLMELGNKPPISEFWEIEESLTRKLYNNFDSRTPPIICEQKKASAIWAEHSLNDPHHLEKRS